MGLFAETISEAANNSLLSVIITRWLLRDETCLGSACADLLSHLWVLGYKTPIFSKDIINGLDNEALRYIIRRMLGWTFHAESVISLAFSLLDSETVESNSCSLVYELLVGYVGRNYLRSTLQAIESRLNVRSFRLLALLLAARNALLIYVNAIGDPLFRHEFQPPARLRRAIALKKAREQRAAMEKASSESPIQSLFSKVPIKAGTGWFSVREKRIGAVSRLGSHSFLAELPAQSMIDPVNDEIERFCFRLAKRSDK